jgi:hypothetical protein
LIANDRKGEKVGEGINCAASSHAVTQPFLGAARVWLGSWPNLFVEFSQPQACLILRPFGRDLANRDCVCWEFIHSSQKQGWLILESRSVSYGKATPYLPVIDLLKAYFQIEGHDETGTMRDKARNQTLEVGIEADDPIHIQEKIVF